MNHKLRNQNQKSRFPKILMGVFLAAVLALVGFGILIPYVAYAYRHTINFPSTINSIQTGDLTRFGTTLCPNGQYMSGLIIDADNDWDRTQVRCSPVQSESPDLNNAFQSTTKANEVSTVVGRWSSVLCPDGQYLAGIRREDDGDWDYIYLQCAPAPEKFASFFKNTIISAIHYDRVREDDQKCPDGWYMSGLEIDATGDWDRKGIYCSEAPPLTGDLDLACLQDGTCNNGFACNSSNVCSIPPSSRVDTAGNSCELNSSGPEWTANYKPDSGGAAYGYGTAVDSAGNIYVTGEAFNAISANSGLDMFLARYNPDGTPDRNFGTNGVVRYDAGGNESGYGVAVDSVGNIYVVGAVRDVNIPRIDGVVIKYNSSGSKVVWSKTPTPSGILRGVAVSDTMGMVYATGYTNVSGNSAMVLVALRPSDGNVQWNNSQPANNGLNEAGFAVAASRGTAYAPVIYVTGYYQPTVNNTDMFFRKYNSAGVFQWEEGYDSSENAPITDIGRGIAISRDVSEDTVFVTGYQSTNGGDVFLHAYDLIGNVRWSKVYNSGGSQNDVGRAVVADRSGAGRVYVAGSQGTNNDDVFLQEYFSSDYQGLLQNTLISGLAYQDIAYGIAIGPASENEPVYVSGYRASNGGEAFLSKYSCNAAPIGGSAAASGDWVELFVTPVTEGSAPFDITAKAEIKQDSSMASAPLGQLIFDWNWGDDTGTSTGQIANHRYYNTTNSVISHLLQLFAKNFVTGEMDTATTTIVVSRDTPPTAIFIATATSTATLTSFSCAASNTGAPTCSPSNIQGPVPLLVYVNASSSYDASPGKIASFSWNWGDNTASGSGVKTSHTYTQAGTYSLTLTVRDNSMPPLTTITIPLEIKADYKCNPQCSAPDSVCAPGNQCVQCLEDYQCGAGYRCLGTPCEKGGTCSDGSACSVDGRCQEIVGACAAGTTCPDGSDCPAEDGICRDKNSCVLAENSLNAECYIEEYGECTPVDDFKCNASVNGGKCADPENDGNGVCRYARCLNSTPLTCDKDTDCARGDGICDNGTCKYIYDCAYGPGMIDSTPGKYATATVPVMPAMPTGVLPEGQACTQPTPDAPINCEGINGCLYYNYDTVRGAKCDANPCSNGWTCETTDKYCYQRQPIQNSNNSVASCFDEFNGGTGCAYYQYYNVSTSAQTQKANCLLSAKLRKEKKETAGIPEGCVQVARGKDSKGSIIYDYDCSNVDGCYYKSDGGMDCTYTDGVPLPGGVSGNGCIYEPNPEGAIFCSEATKPATGGENYVSCLLNPDAQLPWYLRDRTATTTEPCDTSADCPDGQICLYGACYPQCQIQSCQPGDVCQDGSVCPANNECSTNCASGETCYIFEEPLGCIPGVIYCPNGDPCPADGICPKTPFCLGARPTGNLPFGTSTTTISMRTTQDANCRYSLIEGTPYGAMTDVFSATGSTTHSAEVPGLMPLPSLNTYFVKCQTASGITPACKIEFGVGEPCTEDAQCDGGLSCINGYCQLPYCDGGQPPPGTAFPSDTLSVDIGLNTDVAATCRYSQTLPNRLLTKLDQFLGMPTLFSATGGTSHLDTVLNLVTGNNSYYVLCQETAPPQDITRLCQLSFNIGVCNKEFKCADGWQCVPNTGNGICVPPPCSNVSAFSEPNLERPDENNSFSATTTSVTLQATTDEIANCAYGDSSSTAFDSMTLFNPTGGQAHSAANVSIKGGYNVKYVKCRDADGTDVCSVSFRVGQECGVGGVCPSGQECENGTCVYPICENAYPTENLDSGITEVMMGLTTSNVDSECRYSKTTDDFSLQANFTNTGGQVHSTLVTDLVPGRNTQLVSCMANALPNKIKYCRIPIYVGPCSDPGSCEIGFGCNFFGSSCENAPRDSCVDCKTCPDLPECQPWCERFPWLCINPCALNPNLPQCRNFCQLFPNDPSCRIIVGPASCSFMGITFFGVAVDDDGTCDIVAMILAIISWIAWIVALLAVLSGLRAAYLYITAMGNEKRLNLAKMYIIYTTIGVVVAIVSFGLVAIVRALMGI